MMVTSWPRVISPASFPDENGGGGDVVVDGRPVVLVSFSFSTFFICIFYVTYWFGGSGRRFAA